MRSGRADAERLLLNFSRHLSKREPPLSAASIAAYQNDIRLFIEWSRRQSLGSVRDLLNFREHELFIDSLNVKPRTVQRKGTALRYFREFAGAVGVSRLVQKSNEPKDQGPDASLASALTAQSVSTCSAAIKIFIASLKSPHTARAYCGDLRRFIAFAGELSSVSEAVDKAPEYVEALADSALKVRSDTGPSPLSSRS